MSRLTSILCYRNIGISAHIDAGKTTVTERILYYTGVNYKLGEVHDGTATMDWMEQEQERGITITSAATTAFWSGMFNQYNSHRINIIDTPGHVDFTIEVERSMRILDGAVMVYCAVGGVQPQSETVWKQVNKYNVPRIAFINKMDRIGADFFNVLKQLNKKFQIKVIPLQIPIKIKDKFYGVVDLITLKSIVWKDSHDGTKYNVSDIVDKNIYENVIFWRQKIIEYIADTSDDLMSKYLNGINYSDAEIKLVLRNQVLKNNVLLVTCGTALKNKGIQCLLDSIIDYLPSPKDLNLVNGLDIYDKSNIYRMINDNEFFSSLAFKVSNDPYVGNLTFLRVYSGCVKSGDVVLNSSKNKRERIGRIVQMHANKKEEIKVVYAGDIAAAIGLKNVTTGDTLCDINNPIVLEKIDFPNPVISISLEPKTKNDQEKMSLALSKLSKEDPSFKYWYDIESNQTIIAGMGELHLEIIVERMKREFGIYCNIGKPQVSYRETILSNSLGVEGKYIKQTGGRGQYGHVVIDIFPLSTSENSISDNGYLFINDIKGGVVPNEYISAINKGIKEQLKSGPLAGYPVINIKVRLFFGSYHDVDSSEIAFKMAASIAFKKAFLKSKPVLLEPVMKVEVETPDEYMGDVIGDLNRRRGIIDEICDINCGKLIKSYVPLSEMFGYATDLRSQTQGRALYTMEFNKYIVSPEYICKKIIDLRSK